MPVGAAPAVVSGCLACVWVCAGRASSVGVLAGTLLCVSGGTEFPCEWDWCKPTCCDEWDEASDAERDRARNLAMFLLWAETGRQFGKCPTTIRPCRRQCVDSASVRGAWQGSRWTPVLDDGRWFNVDCGCKGHSCSCTAVCEIELEGWFPEPVEVQIDGEVMPLTMFRVDNGRRLVWEGDGCVFPTCQDLSKPLGEPGTWAVTYRHGLPLPPGGAEVTSELACELLLACNPDTAGQCRLPDNIASLSRQGVDIDFNQDDAAGASGGAFGVPSIDRWVKAANPNGRVAPPAVWSPDVQRAVVPTWHR